MFGFVTAISRELFLRLFSRSLFLLFSPNECVIVVVLSLFESRRQTCEKKFDYGGLLKLNNSLIKGLKRSPTI